MKVRDIMSTSVQCISSSSTLSEAADLMKSFDVGILPVLEDNNILGMITDRDIVTRSVAMGMNPKLSIVRDVFTPQVLSCSEEDDLETAASIMEENQVRRLVVLDENKKAVGIISVGDLALRTGNDHLTYEILEKVCEPSGRSSSFF